MRTFLSSLCGGLLAFAALAAEGSTLDSIEVRVALADDGSAHIVQTWEADVFGAGTEFYVPQTDLGDMRLSGFSVEEEGRPYRDEGTRWRSDRSRTEKAGRFGIVKTAEGLELCWGQGSEGRHIYRVAWTYSNFVKAYDDHDGFNVNLVNLGMKPAPEHVRVVIEKPGRPFERDAVHMWAFGFQGTIVPVDGKIVVESSAPLTESNYVTVMLRFEKGMFRPTSVVKGSFATLERRALEGTEGLLSERAARFLPLLFFLAVALLSRLQRKSRSVSPFGTLPRGFVKVLRDVPYRREIPYGGDLAAAYCGLQAIAPVGLKDLMGARFLRLLRLGGLSAEQGPKGEATLRVRSAPTSSNPGEAALLGMIRSAAGPDGLLERSEFQRWGGKTANRRELRAWEVFEREEGLRYFLARGCLAADEGKRRLFEARKSALTSEGEQALLELAGFKKYLQDFTLINERRVVELELWDEYLVYAALYGIADQVSAELTALYPDFADRSAVLRPARDVLKVSDAFAAVLSSPSGGRYSPSLGGSSFRGGGGGSSGGGRGGGER